MVLGCALVQEVVGRPSHASKVAFSLISLNFALVTFKCESVSLVCKKDY